MALGKKKPAGVYIQQKRGKQLPCVFSLQLSWGLLLPSEERREVRKTKRMTRVPIPQPGYSKQAAGLLFLPQSAAELVRDAESESECGECGHIRQGQVSITLDD